MRPVPAEFRKMRRKRAIVRAVTFPVFPAFSFWIAGRHRASAVREARKANKRGGKALINYLGEHYKDPLFVQEAKMEYLRLVSLIGEQKKINPKFSTAISIKPSQFGFDVAGMPKEETFQNMREVASAARRQGIEVEIDMEHLEYTDFTLGTYKRLLKEFGGGLKVCLQANLKRTEQDLRNIIEHARNLGVKGGVRLVKGVYPETKKVKDEKGKTVEVKNPNALHSEKEIMENFKRLVAVAFHNADHLNIAVGTHRLDVFALSDHLSRELGVPYEPQMLKGIALSVKQKRYKDQKNRLAVYIPYGEDAVEYGFRRAKKFAKLLWHGSKHWVGKGK